MLPAGTPLPHGVPSVQSLPSSAAPLGAFGMPNEDDVEERHLEPYLQLCRAMECYEVLEDSGYLDSFAQPDFNPVWTLFHRWANEEVEFTEVEGQLLRYARATEELFPEKWTPNECQSLLEGLMGKLPPSEFQDRMHNTFAPARPARRWMGIAAVAVVILVGLFFAVGRPVFRQIVERGEGDETAASGDAETAASGDAEPATVAEAITCETPLFFSDGSPDIPQADVTGAYPFGCTDSTARYRDYTDGAWVASLKARRPALLGQCYAFLRGTQSEHTYRVWLNHDGTSWHWLDLSDAADVGEECARPDAVPSGYDFSAFGGSSPVIDRFGCYPLKDAAGDIFLAQWDVETQRYVPCFWAEIPPKRPDGTPILFPIPTPTN